MLTPRMLRPHSIVIHHKLDEEIDNKVIIVDTAIEHVKVQGVSKSRTGGRAVQKIEITDAFIVVVDLTDSPKGYISYDEFKGSGWTVKEGDSLTYGQFEMQIVAVEEVNPFKRMPSFIELTCRRR